MKKTDVPGLFTIENVAHHFGVTVRTIERWRRDGLIAEPHRVLGRLVWDEEDLLDVEY